MEQDITNNEPPAGEPQSDKCVHCGSPWIEKGFPTPLCADCRKAFIKFPIPGVIKIFFLIIIAVVLVAMIRLPDNISLGVHQVRGEKAFKNRQYVTAQKEYKSVVDKLPNYMDAKINLTLASFYAQDFGSFVALIGQLEGKMIEDRDLFGKLSYVMSQMEGYVPSDSFLSMRKTYADSAGNIPLAQMQKFVSGNPDDEYAAISLATDLFNNKTYGSADSILLNVLQKDPNHFGALSLMAALKRERGQFDESISYCDRLLSLNKESVYAMSSKSRTLLKRHRDDDAFRLAMEADKIIRDDSYNLATLALIYHFSNRIKERDEAMAKVRKDTSAATYLEFANDVISNKIKFR
jgi:tetratricopeptide (TPR) repeat protein